jgi:hypothetical protein
MRRRVPSMSKATLVLWAFVAVCTITLITTRLI